MYDTTPYGWYGQSPTAILTNVCVVRIGGQLRHYPPPAIFSSPPKNWRWFHALAKSVDTVRIMIGTIVERISHYSSLPDVRDRRRNKRKRLIASLYA